MLTPDLPTSTPLRLFNKNFTLLWQGQFISNLGIQGFQIATLFWIKHETNSASLMGLMMMLSSIPAILLGPFGGAIADRYSRRKIILWCDFINAVAVLSLALVAFLLPEKSPAILVWIFGVSVITSLLTAMFNPAIVAAIPDLVPRKQVMSANSLAQLSIQIAAFIGQGIGGTLFRLLGAPILLLINSGTYLFAVFSEYWIRIPQVIPHTQAEWRNQARTFLRDTAQGFQYVWGSVGLRWLVIVSAFLSFFSVPVIMLLPFFIEDVLKVSVDWYGWMLAIYGGGTMAGYLLAGVWKPAGSLRKIIILVFMVLEAAGYGILGLVHSPVAALGLAALGGLVGGYITINITTILQVSTPNQIRGRVFGVLSTLSAGLSPVAMGLSGILADLSGKNIPLIYMACGVVMAVLTIFAASSIAFRNYIGAEYEFDIQDEKTSALEIEEVRHDLQP
jgi:MFS transporter, DHA3 family, macrolide efflux protein